MQLQVHCLDNLVTVVEASAVSNTAQLVGWEDGTTYVNMYDRTPFLAPHFKRIPGMKQYHHFEISSSIPGVLKLKLFADSEPVEFTLLRTNWTPSTCDLPAVIPPPGLSYEPWCVPYQKLELTPKKTWMTQTVLSHLFQKPHRQQRDPGIVACVARLDTMPDFTKTRHAHIHDQHNTRS